MNFNSLTSHRLPGVKGFLQLCPRFKVRRTTFSLSSDELVRQATENCRDGILKPGDSFPRPEESSRMSGASPVICLQAITCLIQSGKIRQLPSGRLVVSPRPAY